ncbi:MAG: hypothetical protein KDI07_14865 [Anaerolineae bacterium]|nr:hypothetical protein [Anaerolineae bacterium]
MFKLKADDTFTWPVKAKVPEDGKYKTVAFSATFKILSQDEISRLIGDDDVAGSSRRILEQALISFTGIDVEGDDGETVTDHDERKEILFKYPFMVSAVSDAFAAGISGHKAKN